MKILSATNPHTGKRTNLYEIIEDGRKFWFLPSEISLAEDRPICYKEA